MALIKVARASEIPDGKARRVNANGTPVSVWNIGGRFYAIADTCPHAGGPLSEGFADGKVVVCPWHGWKFSLENGKSPVVPSVSVPVYRVKVEGEYVFIDV